MIRNIGRDNGARSDRCKLSNMDARQHDGSGADVRPVANTCPTGKTRATAHVRAGANETIMLDGGIVVHNGVVADDGIDLDDGAGQHQHAPAEPSRRVDERSGMHECEPRNLKLRGQSDTPGVVADRD